MSARKTPSLYAWMLLSLIVVGISYYPTIYNGFVWDDKAFLYDSPQYRLPELWPQLFSEPFFVSVNYYRPLPLLSYALESQISGLNPASFHLTNLLIHLINTFLVMVLTKIVCERRQSLPYILFTPIIAGLIYGLHPALMEGVAWISGRFDLLLTSFLLLGLITDAKISHRFWRPFIVGMFFLLAALCKEMAVAFALLLPAWHLVLSPSLLPWRELPTVAWKRGNINVYIAVFVAGLLYLIIRYLSLGYLLTPDSSIAVGNPLQHLLLIAKAFGLYISLVIWPFTNISPIHHSQFPIAITDFQAWIALVLLFITVSLLVAYTIRRINSFAMLGVAFILSLFPVIHIIPLTIGDNIVHERFLVFPISFYAIVIALIADKIFALKNMVRFGGFILLSFWLLLSIANIQVTVPLWHSNLSLWTWAVQRFPESYTTNGNLAAALEDIGDFDAVERYAERAIELNPMNASSLTTLGNIKVKTGKLEEAVRYYQKALEIRPYDSDFLNNLGTALIRLNRLPEAERWLLMAIALEPTKALPHYNLAILYRMTDQHELAEKHFSLAYKYFPPDITNQQRLASEEFLRNYFNNRKMTITQSP